MLKKMIIAAILGISLTSFQAMAEEAVPDAVFNAEKLSIDLEWNASGINDKVITVTVDDDGLLSSDNCPEFAWVYAIPEDRQVDLEILLPAEIKSGTYNIYVDTGSKHYTLKRYIHNITSEESKGICSTAYGIGDVEAFKLYASANAASLGLDTDIAQISENTAKAASLLFYEMSRHQTQTPLNINQSAKAVTGFIMLGDAATAEEAVKNYGDVLGIDTEIFAGKTTAIKNKFSLLIATRENSESDIKSIVDECLTLASLTDAPNWNALKDSITENASLIGIDMSATSDFATIPSKRQYEVFVKLFETSSGLTTYADFVADFNSAVNSVLEKIENEQQTENNTSSGGGGGGGSSSSVSVSGGFLGNSSSASSDSPSTTLPQTPVFSDIGGHFSEKYVAQLIKYNAVNGYEDGTFRPNGTVTRAEFVAMAVRTFSILNSSDAVVFSDVAPSDWYYGAVSAMASNNIVTGYDGKFNPNGYITRQEAAVIISNLMTFKKTDVSQGTYDYEDSSAIADWAKSAVGMVTASGIMQGDSNRFRPLDSITRGESATVIARLAEIPAMVSEVTK